MGLLTKSLTGAAVLSLSDLACQRFEMMRKSPGQPYMHDYARTLRMASIALLNTPFWHRWFVLMERRLGPSKGLGIAVRKVALDSVTAGPFFLCVSLSYSEFIKTWDVNSIWPKLKRDYPEMLCLRWVVMLPGGLVNYWLVRVPYRILYINGVQFFWYTYFSWMSNRDENETLASFLFDDDTGSGKGKSETELLA